MCDDLELESVRVEGVQGFVFGGAKKSQQLEFVTWRLNITSIMSVYTRGFKSSTLLNDENSHFKISFQRYG